MEILPFLIFILFPIAAVVFFVISTKDLLRVLKDKKNKVETYNENQLTKSVILFVLSLILVSPVILVAIMVILIFTGVIPFM